jgi:enamine deaminase RidA (YjgF/YER057c/UK114 family)
MAPVEYIQPDELAAPLGAYSHLSVAPAGRFVFVAGQLGVRSDGSLAGSSMEEQTVQVFRNIEAALKSQGLPMSSITKMTSYVTSADYIAAFYQVREQLFPELFPSGEYPPNTLLVVDRLVKPEFVVEIEAIAITTQ